MLVVRRWWNSAAGGATWITARAPGVVGDTYRFLDVRCVELASPVGAMGTYVNTERRNSRSWDGDGRCGSSSRDDRYLGGLRPLTMSEGLLMIILCAVLTLV